jgi:hypothetical protein
MKKESMFLLGLLVVGMIAFTACPSPTKVLFFQQDGNYVLDNNYIMQAATKMSATDIEELVRLDYDFYDKTQGKLILINSGAIRNLTQLGEMSILNDAGKVITGFKNPTITFDWRGWLHFRLIDNGCLQRNEIDWKQYGDLKTRFDVIIQKYNPAFLDGKVVIQGDHIATAAVQISAADISSLASYSKYNGVEEYSICPDPKGKLALTTHLTTYRNVPFDLDLKQRADVLMSKYSFKVK